MIIIELLFWISVCIVSYNYLVYPCLLYWLTRSALPDRGVATNSDTQSDHKLPTVAVVLSAFQEEKHLDARIKNLLASDYPQNRLRVYVGSDGSTDDTNRIIQEYDNDKRVTGVVFPENRGKPSVLNDLVEMTTEDILVFTDANTEFAGDNLRVLVSGFNQPAVGAVCGSLKLYVEDPLEHHEDGLYWQFEQWLKSQEAKLGGLIGLTGGNYAIRRGCYTPIPQDLLVDDLYTGLLCSLNGHELAYDANASAYEAAIPDNNEEYKRRVRIGRGNFQILNLLFKRIWNQKSALTFTFISHKAFRWIIPALLLVALVTSVLLMSSHWIYQLALLVQLGAYGLAIAIHHTETQWPWPNWCRALYYLLYMNLALFEGMCRYILLGSQRASWTRSAR